MTTVAQLESNPFEPPTGALISAEDIHKTYILGDTRILALQAVSLRIQNGELVCVMGQSGSGKSTLMNILGCLDRPSQGRYFLDDCDVSQLDRRQLAATRNRKIGFVFQNFNLLARTTAIENAELPALYARRPRRERQKAALQALELVGMADRRNHFATQLSGGQQQRVAIARALVNQPSLLLADEPTGNLDSHTSGEIMELFQRLNRDGLTIVLVTHNPEIARVTQRTILFRDGAIVSDSAQRNFTGPETATAPPVRKQD